MPKIAFHLNMNKQDKNDFVPIRAKICVQSKAVVKNLPFKVKIRLNEKENKHEPVKWDIEKQRFKMLAIYHSHPQSPALPSQRDLTLSFYPDCYYIIVSLSDFEKPLTKAYKIREGKVTQKEFNIF